MKILRWLLLAALCSSTMLMVGADDENSRFEKAGGKLQCMCGCNQKLLICNHVGCQVSPAMIRSSIDWRELPRLAMPSRLH